MIPVKIYDPGVLTSILHHADPITAHLTTVVLPGIIVFPTTQLTMLRVLFDSGALQSNYIDQMLVDSNPTLFTPVTTYVKHSVRLGDNKTSVPLNRVVTVTVSFIDSTDTSHTALVKCSVLDMPGTQMIIGLPSILRSFFDFFIDLLHHVRDNRINDPPMLNTLSDLSDCIHPWTTPAYPEAIEETNSYTPCSFTVALDATDSPHNEKIKDYYTLLDTHIDPEFLAAVPELLAFLKSKVACDVFVPLKWTGINGITPIELEFSEDYLSP